MGKNSHKKKDKEDIGNVKLLDLSEDRLIDIQEEAYNRALKRIEEECFLQPLITKKCRMPSQKLQREIPHFCMCLQRSFCAREMSLQTYFCF